MTSTGRGEADFAPKTKQAIAAAVNWQCSAPLCKNPAIGADDGTIVNGGTACHIYSAAKNGPRSRGGLSDEQLADASNGLWCCAFHGRIIDANQGLSFPAAQLHMWKKLAEGRVRRAMAVQFAELGWIHRVALSVDTHPGGRWEVAVDLQKNNLLRGGIGVGKSLLLEALGSISSSRHARRLRNFPKYCVQLSYETLIRETFAQVSCERGEPMRRNLGGTESALPPADIAVVYMTPDQRDYVQDRGGIRRLTQLLGIDEETLFGLARSVSANPNSGMSITFRPADSENPDSTDASEESGPIAYVQLQDHGSAHPFNALSGGEQIQVAGTLLIALAREEVRTRPVLLCIDALWQLDDRVFRRELAKLAEEPIQLLVVAPYQVSDEDAFRDFPGWSPLDIPSIERTFNMEANSLSEH